MEGIRTGYLTTVDPDGHLISRPMAVQQEEFNGDLWFFSERDARKVRDLSANPWVNVALGSASTWVSVSGRAEVVEDQARQKDLWNSVVEAWFPNGPEDPNIVLLKVHAESAEYWDAPGGRLAAVLSFAKAKVTGKPYSSGDNDVVQM